MSRGLGRLCPYLSPNRTRCRNTLKYEVKPANPPSAWAVAKRDALPKRINTLLKAGDDLLKEAKGLK